MGQNARSSAEHHDPFLSTLAKQSWIAGELIEPGRKVYAIVPGGGGVYWIVEVVRVGDLDVTVRRAPDARDPNYGPVGEWTIPRGDIYRPEE